MRTGKEKGLWEYTSSILCMLAEINRDHKKRRKPFRPEEFNPTILTNKFDKKLKASIDVLQLLVPGLKHARINFARNKQH